MKLILLITAALSVANALSTPFIGLDPGYGKFLTPRAKGDDPTERRPATNRGGPNRDGIRPGRKEWGDSQIEDAKKVLRENDRSSMPKEKQYRLNRRPKQDDGTTGFTYDEKTNTAIIFYGDECQRTSDHLNYRIDHDDSEWSRSWVPRRSDEEGQQAKDRQRRASQRGLPTKQGMVLEEKPAAGVYHNDGEQPTVVWDTEISQREEGIMCSQAYALVRKGGYDKYGRWNGNGGVRFLPNARRVNRDNRPLVGWKGINKWQDPEYAMTDYIALEAAQRAKDSRSSRPSKGKTVVSNSKKPARDQYGQYGYKQKRAGADTITDAETSASTTGSTNSSTNPQQSLQPYLDAWDIVQSNATDIIWPFIEDMVDGTNSSLVYLAAWSICSDLLYMPTSIVGQFSHGWSSQAFDEEQWANDSSISNATLNNMYAINDIVLDLYNTAWNGSLTALNASGYLDDLDFLNRQILSFNGSLPASWYSVNQSVSDWAPYADYFLSYNSTVPDDEIIMPGTPTGYAFISGTAVPLAALQSAWSVGAPYSNGTNVTSSTGVLPTGIIASEIAPSGVSPTGLVSVGYPSPAIKRDTDDGSYDDGDGN